MWSLSVCQRCGAPITLGSRTRKKRHCDICKKVKQRESVDKFMERRKRNG